MTKSEQERSLRENI